MLKPIASGKKIIYENHYFKISRYFLLNFKNNRRYFMRLENVCIYFDFYWLISGTARLNGSLIIPTKTRFSVLVRLVSLSDTASLLNPVV